MPASSFRCHLLPLNAISFSEKWSLHPWASQTLSDDLLESLNRTGMLHLPILLAKDVGNFEILCGYRRLHFACSISERKEIECLVVPQNTDHATILDTILTDQMFSQPLSLVEKARFVEICTRSLSPQDIIAGYLGKLQLRKNASTFHDLNTILQQDPLIITEIHNGKIQDKMVAELLRLPEESDRIALVRLFRDLAMGDGKQKRFFTLIRDISFRQNLSIAEYLNSPAISTILKHPVLNTPQKIEHLKAFLHDQHAPKLKKTEEDFSDEVRSLQLSPQCIISHSPSFEKDDITLSVTFKNFKDCARVAPQINNLLCETT